jgi:hypothetical protein
MRWIVVASLWLTMVASFLQPIYFWARTGEWTIASARGILSPDVYRELPAAQECVDMQKRWGGFFPKAPDRTPSDIQSSLVCHIRLNQP